MSTDTDHVDDARGHVTSALAVVFVLLGSVDLVRRASVLPAELPLEVVTERLRAVMCLILMLQMDLVYTVVALAVMTLLYQVIRRSRGGVDDLAAIFHGVMTQGA